MTNCLDILYDHNPGGLMIHVVAGREAQLLGHQQATGLCVCQCLS